MGSNVKVAFNAGRNANHVPSQFAMNYQRAMSNGGGEYIAYQFYEIINLERCLLQKPVSIFWGKWVLFVRLYAEAVNAQSLSKGEYTNQITVTVNF